MSIDEMEFTYNAPCRGGCGRDATGKAVETADGHVEYHTPEGWLRIGLAVFREGAPPPRVNVMHFCPSCAEPGRLGPALEQAAAELRGRGHLRKLPRPSSPLRPEAA